MKSRRSVDSPGTLTMELHEGRDGGAVLVALLYTVTPDSGSLPGLPRLSLLLWGILLLFLTAAVLVFRLILMKQGKRLSAGRLEEQLEEQPAPPADGLTLLAPLLLGAVDVVFELNADLPLIGLVPDERVL